MSHINEERIQSKVEEIRLEFERKVSKIQEEGGSRIQDISKDTPNPSAAEAVLNASFDLEWKITSIKFDIPKFRMER
ncbi:MAG: hypothetical protein ACQEW9_02265 [Bacteroidota bacterium]